MRKAINAYLRRWADASLRTQLHHAEDKLIRSQNTCLQFQEKVAENVKANERKIADLKQKYKKNRSHDERMVQALRARMPEDLFFAVAAHVRAQEKAEAESC